MKNILFFLALSACMLSTRGQQKKWHDLEGYFQSQQNKEMYVRFTGHDSLMVAKLLWNDGEIHLLPDTGLSFISKETEEGGPIHVRFLREPSGAVNKVNVAGNGLWIRVVNYTPHTKQEMAHTPDQLQQFIGLYQLKEDTTRYIRIGVDSNTLTIHQMWDGNVVDNFAPVTSLSFFKKEQTTFTLIFSADKNNQITQFIAFGRDIWVRKGAQNINAALFKSYEGTYRSTDDPDNEIRLIATDSGLLVRQLWDKKEIRVDPLTNRFFYNEQHAYPLHIINDANGQIKSILVLGIELFNKITP